MASLPLVRLWHTRSLIFHFAILNIKIRFKSTYLGVLWAAIEPMIYFIVLYVVFSSIRVRADDFPIYLITGIMIFHVFIRGTSGSLGSLTANAGIIKSVNIRREFFPVVATAAIALLAFVDVGVFFGLMPIFQFIPPWTIVLLPLPMILVLILVLGFSYLLSIINVFVRDIQNIWIIISHSLLFISPIFWHLKEVDGILLQIQSINPLGQIIEIAHSLVIYGEIPPISDWIYTTIFVFAIFFFGYAVFHRLENKITEEL